LEVRILSESNQNGCPFIFWTPTLLIPVTTPKHLIATGFTSTNQSGCPFICFSFYLFFICFIWGGGGENGCPFEGSLGVLLGGFFGGVKRGKNGCPFGGLLGGGPFGGCPVSFWGVSFWGPFGVLGSLLGSFGARPAPSGWSQGRGRADQVGLRSLAAAAWAAAVSGAAPGHARPLISSSVGMTCTGWAQPS
jgi:hypothetical protein